MSVWEKLVKTMKTLRGPKGCPWDRDQTHESIKHNLLEEAYETLEAIDEKDPKKLKEELGDLLLQVVFHAQMAEEKMKFTLEEVIQGLNEKLVRRHPHVFGNKKAKTPKEALKHWSDSKQKEGKKSHLEGVPRQLPALQRAHRISQKASQAGFDWDNIEDVWKKYEEELAEVHVEIAAMASPEKPENDSLEKEIGDLLFTLVNISRKLSIEPESALRVATACFEDRFKKMETQLKKNSQNLKDLSLIEKEKLWQAVKKL